MTVQWKKFRDLNRRDSYPRTCAKNENSFSRAEGRRPTSMCHAVRNAGARWPLVEIEAIGNRDHVDCRHGDQFAVASVDAIAQNRKFRTLVLQSGHAFCTAIAEMHRRNQHTLTQLEPGHVFADFHDLSRDIAAEDMWQVHTRQPFAHPDIQMVERASLTRTKT